jgi:cell division protein FtsL
MSLRSETQVICGVRCARKRMFFLYIALLCADSSILILTYNTRDLFLVNSQSERRTHGDWAAGTVKIYGDRKRAK